MSFELDLRTALSRALSAYIRVFADVADSFFGFRVSKLLEPAPPPIDERLQKLEVARTALAESLGAIEELQREAEKGKIEYARVTAELSAAIQSKEEATQKLNAIKRLMAQDINAFQALAGVPNVNRERLIGFLSGVFASVVASGLVAIVALVWKRVVG